ncbi:organomercurial lyase [Pseudarthrobacter sp. N5]|uniref:organomercurial lyase n=1 Tax=Pseudarthrobacter sp. N5 TaxID=3418416 RepID=UPI003CF631B6
MDTLILPAVLGTSARIESACSSTGTQVRVSVGTSGVTSVEPATTVVSLVHPEDMSSVRSAFCRQVHFFASPKKPVPGLKAIPAAP